MKTVHFWMLSSIQPYFFFLSFFIIDKIRTEQNKTFLLFVPRKSKSDLLLWSVGIDLNRLYKVISHEQWLWHLVCYDMLNWRWFLTNLSLPAVFMGVCVLVKKTFAHFSLFFISFHLLYLWFLFCFVASDFFSFFFLQMIECSIHQE